MTDKTYYRTCPICELYNPDDNFMYIVDKRIRFNQTIILLLLLSAFASKENKEIIHFVNKIITQISDDCVQNLYADVDEDVFNASIQDIHELCKNIHEDTRGIISLIINTPDKA